MTPVSSRPVLALLRALPFFFCSLLRFFSPFISTVIVRPGPRLVQS